MPIFIDQLERSHLKTSPRIVSLVPSQTELLYDLGLEEKSWDYKVVFIRTIFKATKNC
jgi:ABC-type Fe3+-hydroxamate transport system substrate-binding protein